MTQFPPPSLPEFVSRQVCEARRFFLDLTPDTSAPLSIVCGGVERMDEDYKVVRDDFPYFAIELVAEGAGSLVLEGARHALSPGSVFAYGPHVSHEISNQPGEGMRKYYLDFVGTQAYSLLSSAGLRNSEGYQCATVGGLHEFIELFDILFRNALHSGPMVATICESLAYLLFQKLRQMSLPNGGESSRAYATYERIRLHIEANFLTLRSAKHVAVECSVSTVYLSRLFKRFSDCGAHHYLMRQKMNYAAALLANEGLLVKDVAEQLGFSDAFQFSRSFKRIYGIPPTELKWAPR